MKEIEDIDDNKIGLEEEEDFKIPKNKHHKEIKHSKENDKQREQYLKNEKKIKSQEKKNFLIQDKLMKKKIENEKNKERLYKLSPIENFFLSLIKKISCIRENKMMYQIIILYIILSIIIIIALTIIKFYILGSSFLNFLSQNYFNFIYDEVVKCQNMLKIKSDEKNNNNMISTLDEQLLFMEIYNKELIKNDITKVNIELQDNNENNNNNNEENNGNDNQNENESEKSYEDYFEEKFKISENDLKDLVNKGNNNKVHNLKNLIIYYYNFVPIIYQYLESLGLNVINFYFIGNPNCVNTNNVNKINNLYFKFPLEKESYELDIAPKNDKIHDYIIDPYISCNNGFDNIDNKELITNNNWYYKLYQNINNEEINFRLFQLMKINQIHTREDYYMIFNKFNNEISNLNINFLFAIRISKFDIGYPFIKFNIYNDTLAYDFLSIYNFNFNDKFSSINDIWENINDPFHNDYDADNGQNLIFKNPKFIENMGFFGLQNNKENINNNDDTNNNENNVRILKIENDEFNRKIPLDNNIMIKYNEINDISNKYQSNHYYDANILYFKLIYFFNQFLQYKKIFPKYLTSEEENEESERQNEETNNQVLNPCSISDLDEYYSLILSKFDYDCIYDYCFFHNCEPQDSLYAQKHYNNIPNCYCIPLFCRDQYTQKNSNFEQKIREELLIDDDEEFDFSFTSKYDYYMNELQTPFSKVNEFFDRNNFKFKCEIEFDKKNNDTNKRTFIANVYEIEYNEDNIFFMYLYNLENLKIIMDDLELSRTNFILYLILTYILLNIALAIVIFIYVRFLCNKLIFKMNNVKNIRKLIISNAYNNSNNDKDDLNEDILNNKIPKEINNKQPKNSTELLIKNKSNNIKNSENEILIKEGEENKKNKDKIKQEENCDNPQEEDELDELIKLIKSNLSVFKIEFNLNEESNDNLSNIKSQYEEIIQVNKLKNKLLLKEKNTNFNLNINNTSKNSINSSENENNKKKEKIEDLSVNIFCELLSLSNPKIDFSNIKTNFYYKENKDNSLYGLKNVLENMNEGNNVENIDIINIEKLKNALEHYEGNIHNYWKNYYELQKSKDEI